MSEKTIDDQIKSVVREIGMRQRCYPAWVKKGTMTQDQATHEIACMESIHRTLAKVRREQESLGDRVKLTKEQAKDMAVAFYRWWHLKPGEIVEGVEKAQGLKAGEKVKRLGKIRIVSVRPEPLNTITPDDVVREGFPDRTPAQFVEMFTLHHGICPDRIVNRIEFGYLD